ncbi:MAG: hypothetical protein LBV28_02505 [Puniceicoccales bacterium]|jgi:hypothetical protein|nr:hypothetical protein [Puniceicoccales bacterium]
MTRHPHHPATHRPAFTLVEILTATAIMIVILVFVLMISVETFNAYDSAMSKLAVTAESRMVLTPLQQDLEAALIGDDETSWLQIVHAEAGNVSRGSSPVIMLLTGAPDRTKREGQGQGQNIQRIPGDMCAVKYQIAQRSPFENPGEFIQQIYGLYRAVSDARATFENAIPLIVIQKQDPTSYWQGSAEVLDLNGNRTNQSVPDWSIGPQNFQATNIVSLNLVFWYQNDETKKLEVLVHADIAAAVRQAYGKAGIDVTVEAYNTQLRIRAGQIIVDDAPRNGTLKSVDMTAVLLSPEGAKELRGLQQAQKTSKIAQTKFDELVRKYGVTFSASASMN